MFSKEQENELEKIKIEIKTINNQLTELKNKEYKLNDEYTEIVKEKCRENIGRCFKKIKDGNIISYCKIVEIDKPVPNIDRRIYFNDHQYPSIWFKYPYKDSKIPFYIDDLFSGAWGNGNDIMGKINNITYEEISKEEFIEKFNEVNLVWVEEINLI